MTLPTHEVGSNKSYKKGPTKTLPSANSRGKSVGSKSKLRNKCRKGETEFMMTD